MSEYLKVFEGRIKRQRESIGRAQSQIMQGRNVKFNRDLIAKCNGRIAAQQRLIKVNFQKES